MTDEQVAILGRALGHPTRVRIIRELRFRVEASPSELARLHEEARANVNHHLGELSKAGVVGVVYETTHHGATQGVYTLKGPNVRAVLAALDGLSAG